jgi:hypothetical protein
MQDVRFLPRPELIQHISNKNILTDGQEPPMLDDVLETGATIGVATLDVLTETAVEVAAEVSRAQAEQLKILTKLPVCILTLLQALLHVSLSLTARLPAHSRHAWCAFMWYRPEITFTLSVVLLKQSACAGAERSSTDSRRTHARCPEQGSTVLDGLDRTRDINPGMQENDDWRSIVYGHTDSVFIIIVHVQETIQRRVDDELREKVNAERAVDENAVPEMPDSQVWRQ